MDGTEPKRFPKEIRIGERYILELTMYGKWSNFFIAVWLGFLIGFFLPTNFFIITIIAALLWGNKISAEKEAWERDRPPMKDDFNV